MINSQTNLIMSDKKPIHILYFSSFGETGRGGQESLFYLVSNLDRIEFCPHVVVPTAGGLAKRLKDSDIQVSIIKLPKIIDFKVTKKIKAITNILKFIKKYNIKILHTDGPRNTFYAGLAAIIKRKPLIWHVRSSDRDHFDRLLYKLSTKVIIVANSLKSRFNVVDKYCKFKTIYNGVDLLEYRPKEPDGSMREKHDIDEKAFVITVTARIHPMKGQKYLIQACRTLKSCIKNFYVLLAGEVIDYAYLKECEKLIEEFDIQDRVVFLGLIDNVSQLLHETDIVVLPSISSEAFPRSVIEAMAAGKPVIATNVGGCREAFDDKISGFLVPAMDSAALADKVLLLAKNRNLRERIGSEARCRVENMFEIGDKVKQTEKLYYDALLT